MLWLTSALKISLRWIKLQDSLYTQVTSSLSWKGRGHTPLGTTSMSRNNWMHPPLPQPRHGVFHGSGKFFPAPSQSGPTLQATSAWISITVVSFHLFLDFVEIELYGGIILGLASFA